MPNNGLIRYLGLFNQERLVITTPKAAAEVLVTKPYEFRKPSILRVGLGRILGNGLLLAEHEEHKRQRRILTPAFSFRHIKDLYPIFWDKARESVHAIKDHMLIDASSDTENPGAQVDHSGRVAFIEVGGWASRVTLDIIGLAGLGKDFGAIADPTTDLSRTYNLVFKPSRQAIYLNMLKLFLPGWFVHALPIQRNKEIEAASHTIRDICYKLIRDKKEKLACKELADLDILSAALESGGFSDQDLVDQLMTFVVAGHETVASSIIWAIYMLCRYPDMQAKLRQEVRERLPSIDTLTTISSVDIDQMPYLNAVCSEVLRYWAPTPISLREAAVDTTIQGIRVPKGTRILLDMIAYNRDVELWGPDAMIFNPDRWLPKYEGDKGAASGHATSNYAFMTFMHGPRSCIGTSFAKAEFACVLATWVGKFEFELRYPEDMDEAKLDIKTGVTQRPLKGMHVKAKVLDGW